MKLFLLKLIDAGDYSPDQNCRIIVRATNVAEARSIANADTECSDEHICNPNCWLDKKITSCEELLANGNAEVIMSSNI